MTTPDRITRFDRRKAVADALKQIELCATVFRDDLANRTPLRSSTARQLVIAAYEVVHQVAALEGSDEAYAAQKADQRKRPILEGP